MQSSEVCRNYRTPPGLSREPTESSTECISRIYRLDWWLLLYHFVVASCALASSWSRELLLRARTTLAHLLLTACAWNPLLINERLEFIIENYGKLSRWESIYVALSCEISGLVLATACSFAWIVLVPHADDNAIASAFCDVLTQMHQLENRRLVRDDHEEHNDLDPDSEAEASSMPGQVPGV